MKHNLLRIFALALLSFSSFSCEKDYGDKIGPLQDSPAAIPVTVPNATYFERVPIVTTSVAGGGQVSITLRIPADKGKIKEITRVATGTTLANLQAASVFSFNYNTTTQSTVAIPGNGSNEITFTSTLAAYSAYRTRLATVPGYSATLNTAGPAPSVTLLANGSVDERSPNFLRYWFLITLEDNTTIIPTEVRVRILP